MLGGRFRFLALQGALLLGMGIREWGLGTEDWGRGFGLPIPNS